MILSIMNLIFLLLNCCLGCPIRESLHKNEYFHPLSNHGQRYEILRACEKTPRKQGKGLVTSISLNHGIWSWNVFSCFFQVQ